MLAASEGRLEAVACLFENCADRNLESGVSVTTSGWFPTHFWVPQFTNCAQDEDNALSLATQRAQDHVVKYLQWRGLQWDASRRVPLHTRLSAAIWKRDLAMVEELVEQAASINCGAAHHDQVLHKPAIYELVRPP